MRLLANLVEIISTKITTAGSSDTKKVEATVESSSENATRSEVYGHFGFVARPSRGTRGVRLRIGGLSIIVAAFRYDVDPPTNPGEVKHYSTDADGVVQSLHVLTDTGTHVFNKGTGHAARYEDLKTAFDQLKSDFNDLVNDYNLHVHTGVTTGGGSSGAPATPGTVSAADVSDAKSTVMLIPTKAEE